MNTMTLPDTGTRVVDGLSIRYADSGGPHDNSILLTSPWPESLYAFAPIWDTLARNARVVAVDLPGFGRSEGSRALMGPRAMGGFLSRFIAAASLDRPLIVAPDVGTAAALAAAARDPEQFSGMVVGAGATAVPLHLGEPLRSWVVDPDLAKYRSIDPHAIVNAAMDNNAVDVPGEIRADYLASYEGDRFVESLRYARSYPEELPILASMLARVTTPVTVVGATGDHVVPMANAEFLRDRLPNARLVRLDSGHFAWEQSPDEYARLILGAANV